MRRSPFAALLLAALLAGCAAASAPQSAERAARPPKDLPPPAYAPRFEPAGCPFDSGGERVECGYLLVPEDRAHPERATLKLALAIVRSRSSISARTTSSSTSGPFPAAWERMRLRWSRVRSDAGMLRVASAPNPVETP